MIVNETVTLVVIVLAALVVVVGAFWLRKKGFANEADVNFVKDIFGLTLEVIKSLNLSADKQIGEIGSLIMIALTSILDAYKVSSEEEKVRLVDQATGLIYSMAEARGIELNDQRKLIINQLLRIGLQNRIVEGNLIKSYYPF